MLAVNPPRLSTRPRQSWKDLIQDAMSNADGPNIWKVIQGLNGSPDANSPNKAMSQDSRTITNVKSKANVFIHHYARVSKLNMPRADRDRHRQFKKTVTLKAVPHFKWASYYLPSKRSAKKQPALATFHHHFSSHSVLWHSRSHYPYSTHLVLMPIVEESGRLSSLFHC